ncbi:MAG: hypothetical protein IJ614_06630 [Prevotella sp.]|nr:hypothetical protein [Prevotella sp.]
MAMVSTYPQQVETNIYWNLLKDLDENLKIQLVTRLKKSLSNKRVTEPAVADEAQNAYVVMLDKLKTYKAYPAGWDGEDAVPLTDQVIENFSHVLEVIDKQLLIGLTIYPETNGTLLIDCTDKEAGISLGNDKFSYYETKNGHVTGENGIDFSVQAITQVIKKIAA